MEADESEGASYTCIADLCWKLSDERQRRLHDQTFVFFKTSPGNCLGFVFGQNLTVYLDGVLRTSSQLDNFYLV
jgi:hypothetical protein